MPATSGRPRSAAVDAALEEAVRALLAERGYAGVSMEQVAVRAGVSKAAIYRRWPSKAEMVFSVAVHRDSVAAPPDRGSLGGDLEALSEHVTSLLSSPMARHALPGLLADLHGEPALRARFHATFVEPERAVVADLLDRAVTRGELTHRPEPDEVHAQLLGTVFAWLFLLDDQPRDLPPRIADAVLATLLGPLERRHP